MTLKELKIGESAVIDAVGGAGALRQHFLDMGLIPGEKVTLVKFAPMGDPMELQIHGSELRKHCNDLLKRAEDRVRELDQKFGNQQDDDEPEETPVSRRSRRNDDDIPF